MEKNKVLLEIDGRVAIITINRPEKANAIDDEVWQRLGDVIKEIESDGSIRTIILTGAGKRAFSAGLDFSQDNSLVRKLQGESPAVIQQAMYEMIRNIQKIYSLFEKIPVPVIAAINGAAIGADMELTLVCDIRLASENAIFSMPEVKLGLIPDLGGTQRLPRIVGIGKAKELIFTGKRIEALEAKEIGLVNTVFPASKLCEEAKLLAEEIAANGPLAVRASKKAMNLSMDSSVEDGLKFEAHQNSICLLSKDVIEGFSKYPFKKKPDFKGI
ncbi:hypothetical protein B9J77_03600 [candidate division NPL-UPA2 bacterium Unc8]|uniref:Enoyl-CoA hydratase n=1 Tax=candidate division NPL-UPA2 bacterium Unc8 TaxID=1980939 RepID=A0A399FX80_UNCN2|nr:Short-chain-enoyl-CoA hydratase [Bacillota bacterium]MBT9137780.1 Short-chain-enoyl-CoA hydratase [Bacillota bacterium]MBT9146412.1 Short-chain-enoyl-CoA hydratase [Bacillota bacterium]RII00086.1 MAG: hypothetical protein B9J77_03600 [candidate division NPL-UPA2 bacterium Unc8]